MIVLVRHKTTVYVSSCHESESHHIKHKLLEILFILERCPRVCPPSSVNSELVNHVHALVVSSK